MEAIIMAASKESTVRAIYAMPDTPRTTRVLDVISSIIDIENPGLRQEKGKATKSFYNAVGKIHLSKEDIMQFREDSVV